MATANLLVSTAGGSPLAFAANTDDDSIARTFGGTFNLFGVPTIAITVSSNGFLGAGGVTAGFNSHLDSSLNGLVGNTGGSVIAPFFDDLVLGPGASVNERSSATFYALTYLSVYGFGAVDPGLTSDAQVVFFRADTTIGTFHFLAGDIGMGYGNLASTIRGTGITVGVASFNKTTGTPTSADGQLGTFSTLPTGSQFFLYRPDGSGGYNVSIRNTGQDTGSVPEPATFALAGLGFAGLVFLRRDRLGRLPR